MALPGGAVAEMEGVSEQLVAAALECWDEEHCVQLLSARRDGQAPPSQSRTEFWRTGKVKSENGLVDMIPVLCLNCVESTMYLALPLVRTIAPA